MKKSFLLAAVVATLALAGCASTPEPVGGYGCVLPVKRNAGMGVQVDGCSAWAFGPTPYQIKEFDQRTAARAEMARWLSIRH